MQSFGFLEHIGTGILWQGAVVGLAFMAAILCGVLLLQKKRVSPALAAGAAFLATANGSLIAVAETLSWDPTDLERMRLVATTATAARMFGFFFSLPVLVVMLLMLVVASARGEHRNVKAAGAGGALVLLTVLLTIAGGYATGDPRFAILRGVVYLGLGLLVAASMLAADPEGSAPEAGVTAALSFPMLVAAGEASRRGLFELMIVVMGAASAKEHARTLTIQNYYAGVSGELPFAWASVLAACLVGVAAAVLITRDGKRLGGGLAGLGWLLGALLVFGMGELGVDRMAQFAEALPKTQAAADPAP